MEMVLIAAERSRCDMIKKTLAAGRYALFRAESGKEARMKILDLSLSLVIVDASLPDGSAKEVSVLASERGFDTIYIVPDALVQHMAETMEKYGVYVAGTGELAAVFRTLRVSRNKISRAEEKNRKLLERLKNEKMLTKAKCLLARYKAMSVAQTPIWPNRSVLICWKPAYTTSSTTATGCKVPLATIPNGNRHPSGKLTRPSWKGCMNR